MSCIDPLLGIRKDQFLFLSFLQEKKLTKVIPIKTIAPIFQLPETKQAITLDTSVTKI